MEATRVTNDTATSFDHFVFKNLLNCKAHILQHEFCSDHSPIPLTADLIKTDKIKLNQVPRH